MDVNIGKDIVLAVDVEKLPAGPLAHVIYIGLRNILMDAHASIKSSEYETTEAYQAASAAMAEKKLAALLAGEVRATSGSRTRVGDPVKRRAIEIALPYAKAAWEKASGRKAKPEDAKAIRLIAVKKVDENVAFRHLAEKQMEEEAAIGLEMDEELEMEVADDKAEAA